MNVLETTENMMLNRKEIYAELETAKTPSFDEVKELISKKLNASKDTIVVKEILGSFTPLGMKCLKTYREIIKSKEFGVEHALRFLFRKLKRAERI